MVKEKGQVARRVDLIDKWVVNEEHLMCIRSDLSWHAVDQGVKRTFIISDYLIMKHSVNAHSAELRCT